MPAECPLSVLKASSECPLTVILATNVYQIVLVDMMPATGYLTDMHAFALAETVLVTLVGMQGLQL